MKLADRVSVSVMKTGIVVLACFVTLATAAPSVAAAAQAVDNVELLNVGADPAKEEASPGNTTSGDDPQAEATPASNATADAPKTAPAPKAVASKNPVIANPVVSPAQEEAEEEEAGDAEETATPKTKPAEPVTIDVNKVKPLVQQPKAEPLSKPESSERFERMKPKAPSAGDIYSSSRTTPDKATSLSGDESDIDASVRQRIEEDSKRVGKIAENLVGVQGDINRVEKEVLGKVFDMSTMKTFLNAHEAAIKDHEKLDKEQEDLSNQATSLSKQLDKAINETSAQDKKHRATMTQLSSAVAEDKAVIQGLQKELVPLVEMQKEVEKLPPVNANITAQNTVAVAAAQAATEELVYEKSKLKSYQDTTKNLIKELVKQHDYATKCHERLYQLNTQLHEVNTKEARMKYEQGRTSAKGEAMEKFLEEKNVAISKRLKKAKTNAQTITFAKANIKAKIGSLQAEGQLQLEKLKAELGTLRGQSASIETAMMAKITNRKLIEKALRGAKVQVEDMQERLLAGRLDKLQRNNTQMTNDLKQIREGLQKAQISTAKAEAKRTQLLQQAAQMKEQAKNMTAETQDVARQALAKVVAARAEDDEASQKAQAATMEAQASMLVKCSAIWEKEHAHVNKKLKACKQVKLDLQSVKASVSTLTASVKSAQQPGP